MSFKLRKRSLRPRAPSTTLGTRMDSVLKRRKGVAVRPLVSKLIHGAPDIGNLPSVKWGREHEFQANIQHKKLALSDLLYVQIIIHVIVL